MKGGVYRMLTVQPLQNDCILFAASLHTGLQQHCNSFAVALQFVCSDAAANVQQLQAI